MKPEVQSIENELDIRKLCRLLWCGKGWIISISILFAVIALIYSYLVKQEWSVTAITDKPTIDLLGSFYPRQQFLTNIKIKNAENTDQSTQPIVDTVYQEFFKQLASYDRRREFLLQNDYYLQHQDNNEKTSAILLDELISNIRVTPNDPKTNQGNIIEFVAETATDANQQLRRYIDFVSERAVTQLNNEIKAVWAVKLATLNSQLKQQKDAATIIYQRELDTLISALKTADEQGIQKKIMDAPYSALFLLGKPLLQRQIAAIQARGPDFDASYYQNRLVFDELKGNAHLCTPFKPFRYLRTPELPVKRDKPRRFFLLILWSSLGAFCGAGIVLARQVR